MYDSFMAAPKDRTPLSKKGEQLTIRHPSAFLLYRLAVNVLRHQGFMSQQEESSLLCRPSPQA